MDVTVTGLWCGLLCMCASIARQALSLQVPALLVWPPQSKCTSGSLLREGTREQAGAGGQSQDAQTFLIFLMSLSSSLGVTVWVAWMRSLSFSRDAI